jgi:uncharacterized protein
MKYLKFIIAGVLFGIIMTKSEAISWFRIQEMFRFQSFHMYGIIGVAVVMGAAGTFLIKKFNIRDFYGNPIIIAPKEKSVVRYIIGGTIFGLGWALTGACPGPMFVNLGYGFYVMGVVILFAILGTYIYGLIKDRLPH